MKLIQVDNYAINPEEVGYVMSDPAPHPTGRETVILVQGVEIRVRLSKAEVEKLLEEA
jgi:hypothetical protein